jgi:hypothetical protein
MVSEVRMITRSRGPRDALLLCVWGGKREHEDESNHPENVSLTMLHQGVLSRHRHLLPQQAFGGVQFENFTIAMVGGRV